MKKTVLIYLFLLIPLLGFAQVLQKAGDKKVINKYLSLVKTEKGYVFMDNQGKISGEYTYVYINDNGVIETIIGNEIRKITSDGRCETQGHANRDYYHILEIMKNLKIIDDYDVLGSDKTPSFETIGYFYFENYDYKNYGYASKNGKYALVDNTGQFLTDFKYNSQIYDDEKPCFNSRSEKGILVSVVLDKFTGKELIATKDSIVHYWNPENYLVKNKSGKYFLTYKNKKREVPKIWSYVENLSIESSLFTYGKYKSNERGLTIHEQGFITLEGKKIIPKNDISPCTNFYKEHCIVLETIKEEQQYNYYGDPLPIREKKVLKIINEKFETVKILDEISYVNHSFNQYGQIIVNNKNASHSYNYFLIDHMGNHIIPPSEIPNRIKEVYSGVYKMAYYGYYPTEEYQQQNNFYNQKGEKLLNQETLRIIGKDMDYLNFKENFDKNYLVLRNHILITLDKENNVLKTSSLKKYGFH
jgi:hypothetical protein